MKLFSNINQEKRVRLVDPRTRKVDYKTSYNLCPKKATDVPDEEARKLLIQDPHLVSKIPFGFVPDNEDADQTIEDVLTQINLIGIDNLIPKQINKFAPILGVEFVHNDPRDKKKKLIQERIDELSKES